MMRKGICYLLIIFIVTSFQFCSSEKRGVPFKKREIEVWRDALGETQNTFPSWIERVIHMLTNRARCDPQADLASCSQCGEKACYSPVPPVVWDYNLNRAARFHSANLNRCGFGLAHDSPCELVSNIGQLYPELCDGSPSCACVGGVCQGTTSWYTRITLFGVIPIGENVIFDLNGDPFEIFYSWLHERYDGTDCGFHIQNGHRYNILAQDRSHVGIGCDGPICTQDFAWMNVTIPKIPSGIHYPQSGSNITFYANWYDTAPPSQAMVNIDGDCYPMVKERGVTDNNATYIYEYNNFPSGCHHYYFYFEDANGVAYTYPDTGSFQIGCGGDVWDPQVRPPECGCIPDCEGKECGDDGCGGSCGSCTPPEVCNDQGQCVCIPDCEGKECGDDGCGGSCGSCNQGFICQDGQCVCPQGYTECNGECVDINTDPENCGGCGNRCNEGEVCSNGRCSIECDEGLTLCGDSCVDLMTDHENCGSCGNRCDENEECIEGECICVECDGGGVDSGIEEDIYYYDIKRDVDIDIESRDALVKDRGGFRRDSSTFDKETPEWIEGAKGGCSCRIVY